jgi:hypothetical protein
MAALSVQTSYQIDQATSRFPSQLQARPARAYLFVQRAKATVTRKFSLGMSESRKLPFTEDSNGSKAALRPGADGF